MTYRNKTHSRAEFGEYADELGELFDKWGKADNAAAWYCYDEQNPYGAEAVEDANRAWAEYTQRRDEVERFLDRDQADIDETYDGFLTGIGRV